MQCLLHFGASAEGSLSFRGHTVKNSFGRSPSVVLARMAGSLYLCRVVIGRECRQLCPVSCSVVCALWYIGGMDLDRLDDFLHFVYCTVYINFVVTFDDF